jgi:hypothetical protein
MVTTVEPTAPPPRSPRIVVERKAPLYRDAVEDRAPTVFACEDV